MKRQSSVSLSLVGRSGFSGSLSLPVADGGIRAGFPSPAQDYIESGIDLNRELVKNPPSTFFGRVSGDSMTGAGIDDGDLIVIDKSLQAGDGDIAVCFLDGEFTLKRIRIEKDAVSLVPENPKYKSIRVAPDQHFIIWGVVTYCIKCVRKKTYDAPEF